MNTSSATPLAVKDLNSIIAIIFFSISCTFFMHSIIFILNYLFPINNSSIRIHIKKYTSQLFSLFGSRENAGPRKIKLSPLKWNPPNSKIKLNFFKNKEKRKEKNSAPLENTQQGYFHHLLDKIPQSGKKKCIQRIKRHTLIKTQHFVHHPHCIWS